MEIVELKPDVLPDWAAVIPEELYIDLALQKKGYYACGITFLNAVAGAICWKENADTWELQSIYVFPEYRRLGLASDLLGYLIDRLKKSKCKHITISYGDDDKFYMLGNCLVGAGFDMEVLSMPMGQITLQEASDALKSIGLVKKPKKYGRIGSLLPRERSLCDEWMIRYMDQHIDDYETDKPASYVMLDEGELTGLLLFSQDREDIMLDFCKIKTPSAVKALPLLVVAVEDLLTQYSPETKISMFLSNEAAVNIYSRLFKESTIIDTTVYRGDYTLEEF